MGSKEPSLLQTGAAKVSEWECVGMFQPYSIWVHFPLQPGWGGALYYLLIWKCFFFFYSYRMVTMDSRRGILTVAVYLQVGCAICFHFRAETLLPPLGPNTLPLTCDFFSLSFFPVAVFMQLRSQDEKRFLLALFFKSSFSFPFLSRSLRSFFSRIDICVVCFSVFHWH